MGGLVADSPGGVFRAGFFLSVGSFSAAVCDEVYCYCFYVFSRDLQRWRWYVVAHYWDGFEDAYGVNVDYVVLVQYEDEEV